MSRVLIVDDNAENRYLLQALLAGLGHAVVVAAHGAEALGLAREAPPDLAVSDILMPVMDGFALCREWKADRVLAAIPFMFYTATYTEPKDEAFALSLGADRFVVKPQDPEALAEVITGLLTSRAAGLHQRLDGRTSGPPLDSELSFVRQHRDAVIRKLEDKMAELEAANEALHRDAAERRRAEEAAREAERRYRGIFDNAIEGIFLASPEGHLVAANPALARMLGYGTPEELLAAAQAPTFQWEADAWTELLRRVGEHGEVRNMEGGLLRGDGRRVCLSISARVVADGAGGPTLVEGLAEDVSERKYLERELLQAQKMEAIGRLAGGIAHDFNNILQAMLSQVEMLPARASRPGGVLAQTNDLVALIRRGAALTRQLLLFSRRDTSRSERLDLNEVVQGTASLLRRLIRSDIAIEMELAPDPLLVAADRGQIEQVLMNLVINASDAMPNGGRLWVRTGRSHDGFVFMAVEDTGTGIPESIRERLFDPFFTTKPAGEGTGLGLSVVHGIVARHGGEVLVETEVGRGSCFTATFPSVAGPESAGECSGQRARSAPSPREGQRILVVEDETGARAVLGEILGSLGYHTVTVGSGAEARGLLDGPPFALMITDLSLPDVSGLELASELSGTWTGMKVVLMSGFAEDEAIRHQVATGAARFLQKPFSVETLANEVCAALNEPSVGS